MIIPAIRYGVLSPRHAQVTNDFNAGNDDGWAASARPRTCVHHHDRIVIGVHGGVI